MIGNSHAQIICTINSLVTSSNITYMDAILKISDELTIEPEVIGNIVIKDKYIVSKLTKEARALHLLKVRKKRSKV